MAFAAVATMGFAQDAQKILDTFKRNFAIASLDVKEIIEGIERLANAIEKIYKK